MAADTGIPPPGAPPATGGRGVVPPHALLPVCDAALSGACRAAELTFREDLWVHASFPREGRPASQPPSPAVPWEDGTAVPLDDATRARVTTWFTGWGDLLLYTAPGWHAHAQRRHASGCDAAVLGLDVDGTLVTPRSGARFPRDADDWTWRWPEAALRAHIRAFHAAARDGEGVVVLFTNQGGMTRGCHPAAAMDRLGAIARALHTLTDLPVAVLAAPATGAFRKPCFGMWTFVCNVLLYARVSRAASAYVGDAAGRVALPAAHPHGKGDHSAADLLFALNCGFGRGWAPEGDEADPRLVVLRGFMTPEAFFARGRSDVLRAFCGPPPAPPPDMDVTPWECDVVARRLFTFVPWRDILTTGAPAPIRDAQRGGGGSAAPAPQELVVVSGPPGSGKSVHCARHYPTHTRIHPVQGGVPRARAAAAAALRTGASVVVDATNLDPARRRAWARVAVEAGVVARGVRVVPPLATTAPDVVSCMRALCALHANAVRGVLPGPGWDGGDTVLTRDGAGRTLPFRAMWQYLRRLAPSGAEEEEGWEAYDTVVTVQAPWTVLHAPPGGAAREPRFGVPDAPRFTAWCPSTLLPWVYTWEHRGAEVSTVWNHLG